MPPKSLRRAGMRERLVQRAPGEAERGGADRRAEDVERRHRDLEAVAGPADAVLDRHAAGIEAQRRERMRRDHVDALGDAQAGRVGLDQEGRQPARARRLAGAGEDDVMVGDAAIRDPGLLAVDADMAVAVRRRRRRHRGDIRAGLLLRQREGGDALALAHAGQDARLHRLGAGNADRAGAEPLHGEGEIGEPVARGQNLAGEAERAHVERLGQPAIGRRHDRLQEAGLAQRRDPRPAGGVDIVMRQAGQGGVGPGGKLSGEGAVAVLEERPVERVAKDAECRQPSQLPSKTGFCLAAKA